MSVLAIGATEREAIAEAKRLAAANLVPLSVMKAGTLADLKLMSFEERSKIGVKPPGISVLIPVGYRAAFSYEAQPDGVCSHLSIGVEGRRRKGMLPSPEAVAAIAKAFGVPFPPDKGWTEEYEPGEYAINLVSFFPPKQGTA